MNYIAAEEIPSPRVFSEEWFALHQKRLLWLLNSRLTRRWFRWVLRFYQTYLPLSEDVTYLGPNRVTGTPQLKNGRLEYRTEFRAHPKYAKRLYFAFKWLWWLMHAWDFGFADRFPSFERLSFGFSTLTAYPDAGSPGTTTHDAELIYASPGGDETWSTIRGQASGTSVVGTGTAIKLFRIRNGSGSSKYNNLHRAQFLFDTSGLGSGATITGATIAFAAVGTSQSDTGGISPTLALVSSNPGLNTTAAITDFSLLGTTDYATRLAYASWDGTAGNYNTLTLNSTGLAAISKTGITKFGTREGSCDLDNVAPGGGASATSYLQCSSADTSGSASDPKLDVTYSTGASTLTIAHTADSNKRIPLTNTHSSDANKRLAESKIYTTDTNKRSAAVLTHTLDSNKRTGITNLHTSDSNKRADSVRAHATDSLLRITTSRSHSTSSNQRSADVQLHGADSYLRQKTTSVAQHSTDTVTRGSTISRSHTADSLKRTVIASWYTKISAEILIKIKTTWFIKGP